MTTHYLNVYVPGEAVPQGSKRHVGGGRMIEASARLRPWRATVARHVLSEIEHMEKKHGTVFPFTGPVGLVVTFHFPRPKHHYRSGKFANMLRAVAPREMQVGPDLDKLVRAIGDALTDACAVVDDKQICLIRAAKKWTTEDPYTSIQLEGTHR